MRVPSPVLTVVVPTFNEARNVPALVERLDKAMAGIAWEVVFVDDDSPDRTWRVAKQLAQADSRIRCIRRIGRRGRTGACIEGVLSSAAPHVAVIASDLDIDVGILPGMLALLQRDEADIAIGSQSGTAGSVSRGDIVSRVASRLLAITVGRTTGDPLAGFFAIRREVFEQAAARLPLSGYRILLDLLASVERPVRTVEVGYGAPEAGQRSGPAFDLATLVDILASLLHRWTRGVVPVRFLLFASVGAIGVGVHFAALRLSMTALALSFEWSQTLATFCAMTSNFAINNLLTYRDMMLRGRSALTGLLRFYAVCSIGAVANIGVASYLFESADSTWWVAGLAGIIVGTAFNYTMSSIFIWGRRT